MPKLVNRAKMTTATTGTGTLTLGAAVDGFQTFAAAGVANTETVRYVIEDGTAWEIGSGVYTASGTTLTRVVDESSNADAALDLTGSAVVYVTAAAEDFTIADDAVTNAKLANMATATIKGRTTAGTGDPEDLTPAQARSVIGAVENGGNVATIQKITQAAYTALDPKVATTLYVIVG